MLLKACINGPRAVGSSRDSDNSDNVCVGSGRISAGGRWGDSHPLKTGLAPTCLRLMFEPRGADAAAALKSVIEMERVLDRAGVKGSRLLHGSGGTAWALIEGAKKRGYDTRAGLEDTVTLPDGSTAPDTAAIVAATKRIIEQAA